MPDGNFNVNGNVADLAVAKAFWQAFTGDASTPIRLRLVHPVRRMHDPLKDADGNFVKDAKGRNIQYPVNPSKEVEGTLDELWPIVCWYQEREAAPTSSRTSSNPE